MDIHINTSIEYFRYPNTSEEYLRSIKTIVNPQEVWLAFKHDHDPLCEIEINGIRGYADMCGNVMSLHSTKWDDLLCLAAIDPTTYQHYPTPLFSVKEPTSIGLFEDVYKLGYDITPVRGLCDFNNNPIIVRKVRKSRGNS